MKCFSFLKLLCAIFDGLVEKNDNGEIKGALAKEWSISEDGLNYIFIFSITFP